MKELAFSGDTVMRCWISFVELEGFEFSGIFLQFLVGVGKFLQFLQFFGKLRVRDLKDKHGF